MLGLPARVSSKFDILAAQVYYLIMKKKMTALTWKHLTAILIIAAVISISLVTTLLLDRQVWQQRVTLSDQKYNLEKLQFCYKQQLRPCDDETIKTWNKEHPSDTFQLTTHQQRIDKLVGQQKKK